MAEHAVDRLSLDIVPTNLRHGRPLAEIPPDSLPGLTRHITTAGIAGVITGLVVGGLGGRLFMRIAGAAAPDFVQGASTEAGNRIGEITVDGTLALVIFVGVFVGIAGAVLYAVFRPWLRWAGRYRGVTFGILLFAVGSAVSDALNPDNQDFFILHNELLNVSMIVALFLGFGVMIDWMFRVLDRRLPPGDKNHRLARFLYVDLALGGLIFGGALTTFLLFNRDACDCDPPIIASAFVVVAAAGTLLWWVAGIRSRTDRVSSVARVLGFAGLTGASLFGLIRAVSDAAEVIT